MERKCKNCGTWNKENPRCTSCDYILNYRERRINEDLESKKARAAAPKDKATQLINGVRNHKSWAVRAFFYVIYSVWFVFALIVSSFLYIVAVGPG